jgi:hypothetical protein
MQSVRPQYKEPHGHILVSKLLRSVLSYAVNHGTNRISISFVDNVFDGNGYDNVSFRLFGS